MNFIKSMVLGLLVMSVVLLVVMLSPPVRSFMRDFVEAEKVGTLVDEVETQLGFDNYFPPKGQRGGDSGYPIGKSAIFANIEPQGVFDRAGFKHGDAIPLTHYEFFGLILLNQGQQIDIPIIRDGENMIIQVNIPQLELSYDPCEFRVFECN